MGLDMYLIAKKGVSGFEFSNSESKKQFTKLVKDYGVTPSKNSPIAEVNFTIGYWRKANAIHGWFVRELAEGVDECQPIYVARQDLERLKSECLQALNKRPAKVGYASSTITMNIESTDELFRAVHDNMVVQSHAHEFNDVNNDDPLKPTAGYFFGSTDKDAFYYEALEETVSICDDALSMGEEWSFEYQASW